MSCETNHRAEVTREETREAALGSLPSLAPRVVFLTSSHAPGAPALIQHGTRSTSRCSPRTAPRQSRPSRKYQPGGGAWHKLVSLSSEAGRSCATQNQGAAGRTHLLVVLLSLESLRCHVHERPCPQSHAGRSAEMPEAIRQNTSTTPGLERATLLEVRQNRIPNACKTMRRGGR